MDDYESSRETTPENVGDRARSAARWRALSKIGNYGMRVGAGIVLARLLMPDDFGIVSMATIVTGLALMFRDLGFGQALVQRPTLRAEHIKSAFWFTLIIGGILYGLMYAFAPALGSYFDDTRMVPVLQLISITFLIGPLNVVPGALLQRDLDFKNLFFVDLAAQLAYAGVGISLALTAHGYWSLVWAELLSVITRAIVLCIVVRYFPPIVPTFKGVRDLIGFGGGITLLNFLYYARTRIDYLFIGRRLVAEDLGNYQRAYTMGVLPSQMSSSVVNQVLFSALSRIGTDKARVRAVYSRVLTTIALLGLPAAALIAVSAPELIPGILGPHWSGAIVSTQILCAVGAATVLCSPMSALAKAMDHVYPLFFRYSIVIAVLIPGVWFTAGQNIEQVSWVVAGSLLLYAILLIQLTQKIIDFGLQDTFQAIRGPLSVAFVTAATAELTRILLLNSAWDAPLFVGLATVGCGLTVGIATTVLLRLEEMQAAKKELTKWLPI